MIRLRTIVCLVSALACQSSYADDALDAFRIGQYHKAAQLFQKKAPQTGDAYYALAEMYLYGYGQPRQVAQAIAAYTKAAELHYLPALQVMARYELLVQYHPDLALNWFKKAAELQDVDALMYCAAAYLYGIGTDINVDTAKKYFIAAAKLGNPLAQLTLAQHFFESKSGKNTQLAWIWLNKACAKDYGPALVYKADRLNQEGDAQQAKSLLEQVAPKSPIAALRLQAKWAESGQKWEEAVKFYQMAIDKGDSSAKWDLANLYAKTDLSISDPKQAFYWMNQAARDQNPAAQKQLINFYQQGFGVEKNIPLANAWLEYQKKSPNAKLAYKMKQAALWLSAGQYAHYRQGPYALKGIWRNWYNPIATQEYHLNLAPKWINFSEKDIFQSHYTLVHPGQISFVEYLDAIMVLKGPLRMPAQIMPHYGLPNEGKISEQDLKSLMHQANLGNAEAQLMLGQCYLHGLQTKVDLNLARFWFEKAKAQDELRAQYELALMNLISEDVGLQKSGITLLKDAAFKGNPHAEYTFGLLSEQGFKDAKGNWLLAANLEQAKNMFRLASVNDFGLAKFRLAEWLSREPLAHLSLNERTQKQTEIRSLYYEAVKNGIVDAKLPLAFYLAASKAPDKRQWALDTAKQFGDQGNDEAALLAGLLLDKSGQSQEALSWYAKAKKHPIGGFVWSCLSSNQELIKSYLERAAAANFSYAYLNLAVLAHQEHSSDLDYLQKADSMGNSMASHLLANQHVLSGTPKDLNQAVAILQKLADKGDLEGKTKLAYLLIHGLGTTKNAALGQQYLLEAASSHHIMAQFLLGQVYHLGQFDEGVNDTAAKYWLSQAAKTDAAASINLGFIYETVDKSYPQAQQAYQHALPQIKFKSNYNLGLIDQYGKGKPVDGVHAEQYFKQAMHAGSKQALLALGELYLYKNGDDEQQKQALHWFEKAAKLGQVDAMYRLGLLYETGVGAPVDYQQAEHYYQAAAQKGDMRAAKALERFQTYHLTTAEHSSEHLGGFSHWVKGYFDPKQQKVSVQLQYLGVLDAFNLGQSQEATQDLISIVKDYPYYAPAKNMLLQMQDRSKLPQQAV